MLKKVGKDKVGILSRQMLSLPEGGVAFGTGALIPFYGFLPAAAGAAGAIGLTRLAGVSPRLQMLLGKNPIGPTVVGGLGGLGIGHALWNRGKSSKPPFRLVAQANKEQF